jgi:ankyrin repeat protein
MTALHLAVLGGHEKVCEVLVGNGADVDKRSKEGKTALHFAAINGIIYGKG